MKISRAANLHIARTYLCQILRYFDKKIRQKKKRDLETMFNTRAPLASQVRSNGMSLHIFQQHSVDMCIESDDRRGGHSKFLNSFKTRTFVPSSQCLNPT